MNVRMKVKVFVDCVHGVCEWMEGHNENKLYIVTCNCILYCETFVLTLTLLSLTYVSLWYGSIMQNCLLVINMMC